MFYITKGNEPSELTTFRQSIKNQRKPYNWDDCPWQVKNAIRKQLVKEQNNLCAYCTRGIDEDCQIEHFYSRSQHPQKMFDYNNMLGVDNRKKLTSGFKGICEDGRGSQLLNLSPLDQSLMDGIYYLSDGTIKHDKYQNDLDLVLHLNDNTFKNARAQLLKSIKGWISDSDTDYYINFYKTAPHGGIVVYYLEHRKKDHLFYM